MESQIDLIMHLKTWGYLKSIRVVAAMEHVDRKYFIPDHHKAYKDKAHYFDCGIDLSAPHVHAIALEQIKDHLHNGSKALDVGFGSGYMTACLSVLVGERGCVTGIDNIPELLPVVTKCIGQALPHAVQSGHIKLVIGDGRHGYAENGPYDVIHVGAAVTEIPKPLIDQLKPGGRMFIPVGDQFQVVDKSSTGTLTHTIVMQCKDKLDKLSDPKPFDGSPHPVHRKPTITLPQAAPGLISERHSTAESYHSSDRRFSNVSIKESYVTTTERHASVESHKCVLHGHSSTERYSTASSDTITESATSVTLKDYTYDKSQVLGKGKYGTVFKGYRMSDRTPVAIKQIKSMPENKEWQILEVVRNPYVLCLLDHIFFGNELYVVTEICDCDLRKFMHEVGGTFTIGNMQVVAHQLSKGYMALFSADIIHRDIKPANILVEKLNEGARLKLGDFGCGKILDKLQYAETIVGASGYLAPEVIFRHYDAKADIFSLGLVLYECFFGDRMEQTMSDIAHGVHVDSGDECFNDLLNKMLQYDAKNRMSPTDFFGHSFHASVPNGALIKVNVGYDKRI